MSLFSRHSTLCISLMMLVCSCVFFLTTFFIASAHEVYVLESSEVERILNSESVNPFTAVKANRVEFFVATFVAIMTVCIVFAVSIIRPVEQFFEPYLFNLKKKYGFIIVRMTIGSALVTSGYFQALFGPELPLSEIFGSYSGVVGILLMIIGVCILVGFLTRYMGIAALCISCVAIYKHGWYILTYTNYIGDILFVGFLGAHVLSLDKHVLHWHWFMGTVERFVEKYSFLMLRITFGFSLIYASVYAKFIHSGLALQTVLDYNLTNYFPFDPLFIVLGACIIEVTIGIFIMIGFEVRFTSLFLMFFLTLSLLYFGEAVWPHIVLFGGAMALFIHGYDRYSIEGYFFKNAKHEPIL